MIGKQLSQADAQHRVDHIHAFQQEMGELESNVDTST